MNILFLLRLWPVYGGGETVTICLANEMVKRGWNVSVAYFKKSVKDNLPYIDSKIKSVRIENVNCDEFVAPGDNSKVVQNAVVKYIKSEDIDIVINQWWPYYYIDRLKSETDAKVITCLHQAFYTPIFDGEGWKNNLKKIASPIYESYKKRKAVKSVQAYLPYVDKYVFLSPSFQAQFEAFSGYEKQEAKLYSIPNPLVYSAEISDADMDKKENIVLLVGRMLEGQKRITKAIKIWNEIEKDASLECWRFVVVGEGPDLPMYKSLAEQLGLKRISFEGYQNPYSYYKRAKIFMMTSAFEGFSMTLVEAQQCGVVPVVMDSFLSLHDIITNHENGIIVPNDDIPTYVSEMKDLMMGTSMPLLADNGRKSCLRFSAQAVVDEWNKLFLNLKD